MAEKIKLSYYGEDAERHVLDLYDAGRALYGVARFIYTLENFRVNGTIVEHATSARAQFELLPARTGSFEFDINQVVASIGPEQAAKMLKVPLTALIAWITKKITGDKTHDVDPAIRQATEERETTTRVALEGMRDVALRAISASQASERRQQELINRYADQLAQIPGPRVQNLSSKLRPSLIDMARPTTRGATYMSLSAGEETDPILYMDESKAESLKGNETDDLSELTKAKFIQYNVETGWGKVRLPWRAQPYRFFVHRFLRVNANQKILQAMNLQESIWVWLYRSKDKSGNVISLMFDRFPEDSEIPKS